MLLKLKVEKSWSTDIGKENVNLNQNEFNLPLSFEDKQFIKQNIFSAIDNAPNKVMRYLSLEKLNLNLGLLSRASSLTLRNVTSRKTFKMLCLKSTTDLNHRMMLLSFLV